MPSDGTDTTLKQSFRRSASPRRRCRRHATAAATLVALACTVLSASSAIAANYPVDKTSAAPTRSAAIADDEKGRVVDVVLWFRYAGLVDTYISARSDGEQLYLPMRELFALLHIRCEVDPDAATAYGYFTSDERHYRINFSDGRARIAGREHLFDESAFISDGRDVYVEPSLLDVWFGLKFELNEGEMALSLRASQELPITAMNRRSAQRPDLHDPYAIMRHAPLAYDRRRRNYGGGTLDYGLAVSQDAGGTFLNADAAAGAEVLGGDLRWRASVGHARVPYFRQSDFLWRYVREDDRLSQIRVGTSHTTGLQPVAYHGVHLTNLPAAPRTYYSEYHVAGDAPPDWDVELYLDDRLVGFEKADAAGRYRFTVPVFYGTSMVRVKTYGPAGEERQELMRIQIPFSLITPGELHYNVHAGLSRNSRRWMTQADVGYGISERLSVSGGVDITPRFEPVHTQGIGHYRNVIQSPLPYARLTSRVGTHYLAGFDMSPGGYSRISFSGFLPSHASLELQGVTFPRASAMFADGRRNLLRAGGFMPLYIGKHPASVRLHAARTGYDVGPEYSMGSSIYGGLNRFRLHLATRGEWSEAYRRVRVSPTVSYTVSSRDHEILRHLSGMIVTARADYEAGFGRMERLYVDVTHNIRPGARLSLMLDAGLNGAPSSVGFRLSADLPTARATASAQMRSYESSITQSVRGSMVFDEPNGRLHFDRRAAVGRSAAAVRLYIDENGNGRFDVDEPVIDDDIIRLQHGSAGFKHRSRGITLLSGLLPYTRYTASLDETLLSNPMLVPSRGAFSFIADPNSVKPIDIPLSPAGIVEGRVMELRGDVRHPVAGATIRLVRREDSAERWLQTFSDGTYYDMGLPPGTYDIHLDDGSVEDVQVVPSSRTVTIEPAVDGEVVDGLDFELRRTAVLRPGRIGEAAGIELP